MTRIPLDWFMAADLAHAVSGGMCQVRGHHWQSLRGCGWNGGGWPNPARGRK